jgi:putative hemolysin
MANFLFFFLLLFFTFVSGYISLAMIALFSLSSTEIKIYKSHPDARKQLIAQLLSRPRDLLVTLMMCDIGANILVQNMAANFFGTYSTWALKVGVPLILTLFFGEILPKTLALPNNIHISYKVAPTISAIQKILGPIRIFLTWITTFLSRFFFSFLKKEEEISKEELHHMLKTSENYGILSKDEGELIDGYLSLTDYTVKERMRPRHEILYYDCAFPLNKLIHLFADLECSRVPVCEGDLQNMHGILTASLFFTHRNEIKEGKDVLRYLTKPYYVPETIYARSLLRHFLQSKESMGIVVDEYGSITGLITQEDLFEIVIGDIEDRRHAKTRYTSSNKDVIITSGKLELKEFEEIFGVYLPTESNMVTIGGWLTEQMGDIPKNGTKFVWNNFLFHVLSANPNRVRRLYIRRLKDKNHA